MNATGGIARISLTTADPEAAAQFYCAAFGCTRIGVEERSGQAFADLMGLPEAHARAVVLRLGDQEIELVGFTPSGQPYPTKSRSNDLWFQHFAIVVADMQDAYQRLLTQPGWSPISTAGPQLLPKSSGGVTAFKFRDPEGRPLEFLAFPAGAAPPRWHDRAGSGTFLGIDHSAIAVADTSVSEAFYAKLGFTVANRSLNQGIEQAQLDNVPSPIVEVTGLQPPGKVTPHLELLCYRAPRGRPAPPMRSNDIAKTRLVLGSGEPSALIRDSDGHDLVLRGASG